MNKPHHSSFHFKLNPVAASVVIALSTGVANAGSGYGLANYAANPAVTVPVSTYYANSPSGAAVDLKTGNGLPSINAATGLPNVVSTGMPLRKFVDTLPGFPGLNASGFLGGANDLGQAIPVAVPEKWVDTNGNVTNDDYYEIAAIEFSEQMHADLPKATHLRGYVQLSTAKNPGAHIALSYPDGSPILDANNAQVYAFAAPHHLGPMITGTTGTPVRVKFTNYLPVNKGLFLPVDHTITGAGTGPDGVTLYTENRAEMHLVGGQTPWISAGSPHQWVAPAGETTAYAKGLGKGASNADVPDMMASGPGSSTYYFPNAESARMMFIRDRSSGLTRLNTYAGLVAPMLLSDPVEQSLIASGDIPADQIPLILEDKTFVPANVAQQDAKWDTTNWGQPGDLWFPHVYETNQDPTTIDGTNPVGRWDYGPWFWPIFPASAALPDGSFGNASFTPESYHDTPLVNGTAYPTLTVDPKAYRFRILNASSDRFFNLGWYLADTTQVAAQLDANGFPMYDAVSGQPLTLVNTEVKMVPADADVSGAPRVPGSAAGVGLSYDPTCLCDYPAMAQLQPAIQFSGPNRAWPVDARIGGAPDPTAVGPDFISIGTDGGLLPNPVDVPSQPITYESNRRSVTVTNVYGYGMLVGPSERADAIVDFSNYAGKTLILYNDAPAPFPFNDTRLDYFTGVPDQTANGGAYSTLPGYGPNTRTVMQVKVSTNAAAATYDPTALIADLPAAYGKSQPAPIVPQIAYNAAFGTSDGDVYAHVATGSVAQPTLDFTTSGAITLTGLQLISSGGQLVVGTNNIVGNTTNPGSGQGYDPLNPPVVQFNNGTCLTGTDSASALAVVDPVTHQVTGFTNFYPGSGYTCVPQITFVSATGVGAQATVVATSTQSILVQTKAEQELFDTLGRYNSTGGVELPLTSGTTQTTIPLNYIDQPTEFLADGETQIWKLVDNGFWSNSMHFDFVDVQLINRVGWDGTVKAPASNEVGWKDTLRLNPLEDVIIAMRAKAAPAPFGVPASTRSLDPTKAIGVAGSNLGFTADPGVTWGLNTAPGLNTALLTATNNQSQQFDNEFVWGTAVLSHSEDDFMRPVVFHPNVAAPDAPSGLAGTVPGTISWVDATPAAAPTTIGNPKNEVGFTIERTSALSLGNINTAAVWTKLGNVPANTVGFVDATLPPNTDVAYRVTAFNNAGKATSTPLVQIVPPAAPVWATTNAVVINNTTGALTLNWKTSVNSTSYVVTVNGVDANGVAVPTLTYTVNAAAGNTQTTTIAPPVNVNYTSITLTAVKTVSGFNGQSAASTAQSANLLIAVPATPTGATATIQANGQVRLNWTTVQGVVYQYTVDAGTTYTTVTNGSNITLPIGATYVLHLYATNTKYGVTVYSNPADNVPVNLVPTFATPTNFTAGTPNLTTGATRLNWTNVQNATGYQLSIDGAAPIAVTNGGSVTLTGGMTHSLTLTALGTVWGVTNVASAPTAPVSVNMNFVTVAPPASLTPSVNNNTGIVTVNFGNSTAQGATYLLSVDGGTAFAVTNGQQLTTAQVPLNAAHTLSLVAAQNQYGTVVNSTAVTAPVNLVPAPLAAPAGLAATVNNNGSVNLNWTNVNGQTYKVSADGGAYVAINNGGTITPALTAGSAHTLALQATATVMGTVVTSAAATTTANLSFATVNPPASITPAVNTSTGIVTLNFGNSSTQGATYQLSVDGGTPFTVTNGQVLTTTQVPLNATHTLSLVATNTQFGAAVKSTAVTANVNLVPAPLATPTGVTAAVNATNGAVTLTWTNVTGATSYQVKADNGSFVNINNGGTITPALTVGSIHTLYLQAVGTSMGSTATSGTPATASVNLTVPTLTVPTVTATAPAGGTSTLSWPKVTNATSYNVTVSVNGGTATTLKTVTSATTTITTTVNVATGNSYVYGVTPVGTMYGTSLPTSGAGNVTVTSAPNTTTGAAGTRGAIGSNLITVGWTNATTVAAPGALTWTVVRKNVTTGVTTTLTGTPTRNTNTYSLADTGLVAGNQYTYTISATTPAGNIAAVTTTAVAAR